MNESSVLRNPVVEAPRDLVGRLGVSVDARSPVPGPSARPRRSRRARRLCRWLRRGAPGHDKPSGHRLLPRAATRSPATSASRTHGGPSRNPGATAPVSANLRPNLRQIRLTSLGEASARGVEVWSLATSMTADVSPFRMPIARQRHDDEVVFIWSTEEFALHARFRME